MRRIYAIRDNVAGEITGMRMYTLMTFRTDQEAARYFADAVNDTSSILNKHPEDYELILCGDLDDGGTITALQTPTFIVAGNTILATQQPALVKGDA